MPFTYPGVYIEELPSAVHTITGVGTSIALFVGQTRQGPMKQPVQILNPTSFANTFSADDPGGDLPRAVRLFFANGGGVCWVVRVASGAQRAQVTLQTEAGQPSLLVTAKSAGEVGNSIRLSVDYATSIPESTFNLGVFRYGQDAQGNQVQLGVESWTGLSMDPTSPRYAPDFVTQGSALVEVALAAGAPAPAAAGTSQAGRPVAPGDWATLLGSGSAQGTNRFRISVDGPPFVDVDLSGINAAGPTLVQLGAAIAAAINPKLKVGSQVTVTIGGGPTGSTDNYLTISSANGDVLVEPAGSGDLAVPLLLGSAQGGLEISRYAPLRPAASGIVFDVSHASDLAGLANSAFNSITLDGVAVALGNRLETTAAGDPMFRDALPTAVSGHADGVREKLNIIAGIVNGTPGIGYRAQVWGSRLALVPAGADNQVGSIATAATDIGPNFHRNVRYSRVGQGGLGFQAPGQRGTDGSAPTASDYDDAYAAVDSRVDLFNLLILPTDRGHTAADRRALWGPASSFCQRRRAVLLIDAPPEWTSTASVLDPTTGVNSLRIGLVKDHAAIFYPWLLIAENGSTRAVGPSGAIAGLMARIDSTPGSGVWVAPAGADADIRGRLVGLADYASNDQNGLLNPRGVNVIRRFPSGIVNWGARTMDGDDDFGSQWKYIPIRRLALLIEESLYRGTQFAVFQPNDEPLWGQLRLNVGAFMQGLFRQGAFQGRSAAQAYFVKCDSETTTAADRDLGVVNVLVGFAPLKPAEFVVIQIQQQAGQLAT